MSKKQLLLISNSRQAGYPYLGHASTPIKEFLGKKVKEVLFVPFAGVVISYDNYSMMARKAFEELGYQLVSMHEVSDPVEAVSKAQAIVIGGGNTFHLLKQLYDSDLLKSIRDAVESGVHYVGWSAGANVAGPTIKTTNDMPVVWPPSLDALSLVPFQINPHYHDDVHPGFTGETREERITEYTFLHKNSYVVGLREGTMLEVQGSSTRLIGEKPARIFVHGKPPAEYNAQDSLDFLSVVKP